MLRILYLEDCNEDVVLVEETVQRNRIDAKFTLAKNSTEFLSAFEHEQFDLILADSSILNLEGVSVLKIVRKKYSSIGFICLSDQQNPSHIKASFDNGATDYISKSDLPRLIDALRRELERLK